MHVIETLEGACIDYWPKMPEGGTKDYINSILEATQDAPAPTIIPDPVFPGRATVYADAGEGVFQATSTAFDVDWLCYVKGQITDTRAARDTLTGPMSGCYLFRYTDTASAETRINHVGTFSRPDSDTSVAVKKLWRIHANSPAVSAVKGFNPFAAVRSEMTAPLDFSAPEFSGFRQCWALMTAAGQNYALVVRKVKRPLAEGTGILTLIEAVKSVALEDWDGIRTGTFKPLDTEVAAASTSTAVATATASSSGTATTDA
jgi:hypothetical protein